MNFVSYFMANQPIRTIGVQDLTIGMPDLIIGAPILTIRAQALINMSFP